MSKIEIVKKESQNLTLMSLSMQPTSIFKPAAVSAEQFSRMQGIRNFKKHVTRSVSATQAAL